MRRLIDFTVALLAVTGFSADANANTSTAISSPEKPGQPGWKLEWEETFDGTELDDTRWTRCQRGRSDWNNTMSNDPRLLSVADGVLHLRGIVNDTRDRDPVPFLTAGVTSKGKFAFQYGKVQIRARFKSAQGAWPALWMLGSEKGWPACGEIDLMEHLNFDDKVYQTVHSVYTRSIDKSNTPPKGGVAKIERDDWNTYGCQWDANQIVFTVNGKTTHTYPRVRALGERQWPFDQPFYFILSMQVGGKWVNRPGPTNPAHYPAGMEIDWVRVYRRGEPLSQEQKMPVVGAELAREQHDSATGTGVQDLAGRTFPDRPGTAPCCSNDQALVRGHGDESDSLEPGIAPGAIVSARHREGGNPNCLWSIPARG